MPLADAEAVQPVCAGVPDSAGAAVPAGFGDKGPDIKLQPDDPYSGGGKHPDERDLPGAGAHKGGEQGDQS